MRLLAVLALLLIVGCSSPAFVHGDIYSSSLEELDGTLIRLEGRFSYQLVVPGSNYSIFLPEGSYTISASQFDEHGGLLLYAQQDIMVGGEDQEIDLILYPPNQDILLAVGIMAILAAVFLFANRRWRARDKQTGTRKSTESHALDGDALKVLAALESSDNRATQKELRQSLRFSDAKLSLILTELEQTGRVKKFRRGRANIIRKL